MWRSALLLVTLRLSCLCLFPARALLYFVAWSLEDWHSTVQIPVATCLVCIFCRISNVSSYLFFAGCVDVFVFRFAWYFFLFVFCFLICHYECKLAWSHNPACLCFTFVAVHQYALSLPNKCIEYIESSVEVGLCRYVFIVCAMFSSFGNSCNCCTSQHVKAAAEWQ